MEEIALGINIDGASYRNGGSAWSLYNPTPGLAARCAAAFAGYPGLREGE
jgi:hypothetical protein